MDLPLISVITPSLNQGDFIEGNIRSVLDQDYPSFEHIVIDGLSSDTTLDVLKQYPHLIWKSEEDHSMTEALNKGLRMADGEIIAWLNTDDRYVEGTFYFVARCLSDPSSEDIVMGDARYVDKITGETYVVKGRSFQFEDAVKFWEGSYFLHQPAIFFKRSLLDNIGLLDETLSCAMDYELWLRLSRRYRFQYVPRVLAEVIHHADCITASPERWRGEVLDASKRYWGSPGSRRRILLWSSYHGRQALQKALDALRAGRKSAAIGRLLQALLIRPDFIVHLTWWSILTRVLVGDRAVDFLKAKVGRGEGV